MTAVAPSFANMHEEHRLCHTEHAGWLVDDEQWQAEHQAALQTLKQVDEAIRNHGVALEEHTRAIQDHDKAISAHERELLDYHRTGEGCDFRESFIDCHNDLVRRHSNHRRAHERIKKHHEHVVVLADALKMAIGEAM